MLETAGAALFTSPITTRRSQITRMKTALSSTTAH